MIENDFLEFFLEKKIQSDFLDKHSFVCDGSILRFCHGALFKKEMKARVCPSGKLLCI